MLICIAIDDGISRRPSPSVNQTGRCSCCCCCCYCCCSSSCDDDVTSLVKGRMHQRWHGAETARWRGRRRRSLRRRISSSFVDWAVCGCCLLLCFPKFLLLLVLFGRCRRLSLEREPARDAAAAAAGCGRRGVTKKYVGTYRTY